jgi:hypothetical protein
VRVLAIDPGPTESGVVLFENGRVKRAGVLGNERLRDRLSSIELLPLGQFPACAIEWIESMGMPVGKEVFDTCLWVGRFLERWYTVTGERLGNGAALITRREVKLHLCGSARAKDPNVRQALLDKLGPAGTKKAPGPTYGVHGHLWAALAVAVTYAETRGAT